MHKIRMVTHTHTHPRQQHTYSTYTTSDPHKYVWAPIWTHTHKHAQAHTYTYGQFATKIIVARTNKYTFIYIPITTSMSTVIYTYSHICTYISTPATNIHKV